MQTSLPINERYYLVVEQNHVHEQHAGGVARSTLIKINIGHREHTIDLNQNCPFHVLRRDCVEPFGGSSHSSQRKLE